MKNLSVAGILATAVAMLGMTGQAAIAAEAEPGVELKWALATVEPSSTAPSAVKKDTQLQSGAKLKFFLEPMSPCSVYLLLLDSSDEMHVLYHEKAKKAPAADGKSPTYVPPGSQWFEVDEKPGRETFFLLASATPLTDLDKLIADLAAADAAGKKNVVKKIVDEVRKQQKAHRNFSRPVEKPVVIGGQTRGSGAAASSIDKLAVEISAEKFYDKTITIEH